MHQHLLRSITLRPCVAAQLSLAMEYINLLDSIWCS